MSITLTTIQQWHTNKENYKWIFFMYIDVKSLMKYKQINPKVCKKVIDHDQVGFVARMQG